MDEWIGVNLVVSRPEEREWAVAGVGNEEDANDANHLGESDGLAAQRNALLFSIPIRLVSDFLPHLEKNKLIIISKENMERQRGREKREGEKGREGGGRHTVLGQRPKKNSEGGDWRLRPLDNK